MSSTLRAALVLTLDDKLSSGLNRMKDELDKVKKVGRDITLGGLERGVDTFRAVERAAGELATGIGRIGRAADAAGHKLDSMASKARQKIAGAFTGGGAAAAGKHGSDPSITQAAHAVGGAIGVMTPIRENAKYDVILRQIAIDRGLTGGAVETEIARMDKLIKHDAAATKQTTESIAHAYRDLIQRGLTPHEAEESLAPHSRIATAYNAKPDDLGGITASLKNKNSFALPESQMDEGLAIFAAAAKRSQVTLQDFSGLIGPLAGQLNDAGFSGKNAAIIAASDMATVRRNTTQSATAQEDLIAAYRFFFGLHADRSFSGSSHHDRPALDVQKLIRKGTGDQRATGIDLKDIMDRGKDAGIAPLDAVAGFFQKMKPRLTPYEMKRVIEGVITNHTAANALGAKVQYSDYNADLRKEMSHIDANVLFEDFKTSAASADAALRTFGEGLEQVTRRIGEGFSPILTPLNTAVDGVVATIEKLDEHHKGLANVVLTVTGGLVGLAAGLAALGFIAPAFAAGASLLGGAAPAVGVGLALLPPAAVGYSIWRDWNKPRVNPWDGSDTNINADPLSVPMMDDATAGRNRINIPLGLTNPAALGAAPLGTKTEILIRATPGTEIDSIRGDRGAVRILDPGLTLELP